MIQQLKMNRYFDRKSSLEMSPKDNEETQILTVGDFTSKVSANRTSMSPRIEGGTKILKALRFAQ